MFLVGLLLNLHLDLIIAPQKNPKTTIFDGAGHGRNIVKTVSKQHFVCFLGNLIWGSFGTRFGHHFGTLLRRLLEESTVLWGVKASSLTFVCKTVFEA